MPPTRTETQSYFLTTIVLKFFSAVGGVDVYAADNAVWAEVLPITVNDSHTNSRLLDPMSPRKAEEVAKRKHGRACAVLPCIKLTIMLCSDIDESSCGCEASD